MKNIINKRHSVRKFKESEISDEWVGEILRLGRKAPSAGGLRAYQPFTFIDKLDIERIAQIIRQKWIKDASLVIVLCADPEKSAKRYGDRGRKLYCIQDTTLYGAYLDLLFVEEGWGTCWVGAFKEHRLIKEYGLGGLRPISLLIIGKENA